MSELSPGSKATTNLFIVLGLLALGALAVSVGLNNTGQAKDCGERLLSAGQADLSGQNDSANAVILEYVVTATGEIRDIRVVSKTSPGDETAVNALLSSRYAPEEGAEPLTCRYSYSLPAD